MSPVPGVGPPFDVAAWADADAPGDAAGALAEALVEALAEALDVAADEAEAVVLVALLTAFAEAEGAGAAFVAGFAAFVLLLPDFAGADAVFALGVGVGWVTRTGCGAVPGCLRVLEDCQTKATLSPARTGWV